MEKRPGLLAALNKILKRHVVALEPLIMQHHRISHERLIVIYKHINLFERESVCRQFKQFVLERGYKALFFTMSIVCFSS